MSETEVKNSNSKVSDPDTTHLLLAIFECAIEPQHFSKLTQILEQWLTNDVGDQQLQVMENFTAPIWESLARAHLNLDAPQKEQRPILSVTRAQLANPTDSIHSNFFSTMFVDDLKRLRKWAKSKKNIEDESVFRVFGEDGDTQYALAKLNADIVKFYNISTEMSVAAKSLISQSFGISFTEMMVLQELLSGTKIQDIAKTTGKSVETVRSQVKSISTKLGVSRQQEIVKLITNIQNRTNTTEDDPEWAPEEKSMTLRDGRKICYRIYGASHGRHVLCMHSFSRASHLPRSSDDTFAKYKLRWIVPARAGYGHSSPVKLEGEQLMLSHIDDYRQILDHERVKNCAVLAEGTSAVMAYRFAQMHPDLVEKVFGLNSFPPILTHQAAMAFHSGMYRAGALAALHSSYMLKLITRFVIKRAMQVNGPEQLFEMSGVQSKVTQTDHDAYDEYVAPNLHELFLGKGEGAWRDCTYLNIDWKSKSHAPVERDKILIMQHYNYPLVDINYVKKFCDTIDARFLKIRDSHQKEHLQMSGLAHLISSFWR